MRHATLFGLASLFLSMCGAALPARADFYSFEGQFQCLDQPSAVCYDATLSVEVTAKADDRAAPAQPAPSANAAPEQKPSLASKLWPPQNSNSFAAIVARIKANKPAPDDIAILRRQAASGDAHASELLAWCELHGIGTSRDPLAAYFLYGVAAAGAIPNAYENQRLVYEQDLTPEQRQRALDIEAMPDEKPRVLGKLSANEPAGDLANVH